MIRRRVDIVKLSDLTLSLPSALPLSLRDL
jgi:hypothetical protein